MESRAAGARCTPRGRRGLRAGKRVDARDTVALLEAVLRPGDRVCLEGDNQKQADLLATALADVDSAKIHDLHMVQSGVVLPEHLDVFERGIAKRLDFAYSGTVAAHREAAVRRQIALGAVHTYLELFCATSSTSRRRSR